jgi:hypothetical protein
MSDRVAFSSRPASPGSFARSRRLTLLLLLAGVVLQPSASLAKQEAAVPLPVRTRGAERVLVGRVTSVNGVWRENEFGDRLIVSVVRLAVEETLKGQHQQDVDVEVEGGTIGNLTLRVSDLATFQPGERAVFYLTRAPRGAFVPYMRGQGLLKLDRANKVSGSAVTLDEIRRTAAAEAPVRTPR